MNFSDWIQAVSAVAIVVGVILVVAEMRQNSDLMRTQLINEIISDHFAYDRQIMGENPSPTLIKACFHPEDLSEAELSVAAAAMDYRYDTVMRTKIIEESGDLGMPWRKGAEIHLRRLLETPLGRLDFEKNKDIAWYWDPEIVDIAEKILASPDFEDCTARYVAWKDGLHARASSSQ